MDSARKLNSFNRVMIKILFRRNEARMNNVLSQIRPGNNKQALNNLETRKKKGN